MNFHRHYFLLILIASTLNILVAQEWKYEGPNNYRNGVSASWIDDNGNSYHNIIISEISKEGKGRVVSKHMLILDKHGFFNGVIKVQDCENRAAILPFSKDNFLISGHNCNNKTVKKPDSRVINRKGETLHQGEDFAFALRSFVKTEKGYTVFSKNYIKSNEPTIEFKHIDWNYSIKSKFLDISEFNIPNMYVGMSGKQPVQGKDGNWLIPANMGVANNSGGISIKWDFAFLTDEKKIIRKFPKKNGDCLIESLKPYKGGYAILVSSKENYKDGVKLNILNQKAKTIKEISFDFVGTRFHNFLITNEHIYIVMNTYDLKNQVKKYYLRTYNMEGELLSERLLSEKGRGERFRVQSMFSFDENSILLSGSSSDSKKNVKAYVWKIDINQNPFNTTDKFLEIDESEHQLIVKDVTIENLEESILSVAAFPNPTSIYINFSIDGDLNREKNYRLEIYSINGRKVFQDNLNGKSYELYVQDLSPGTYSYRIFNIQNQQDFFSGKFIKI